VVLVVQVEHHLQWVLHQVQQPQQQPIELGQEQDFAQTLLLLSQFLPLPPVNPLHIEPDNVDTVEEAHRLLF
jgi:hypothetical protein